MSQALWHLQREGIGTATITGLSMTAANAIHDRLGWRGRGLLDLSVTSDDVERGAPLADAVYEVMERSGVRDAARIMLVSSAPAELQQGWAAGCGLVTGIFDRGGTYERVSAAPHHLLLPACALVPETLRRMDARRLAPISFGFGAT
jgi:beta-phosphoglucomutase-like phosphatase (HAD superfamily)